MYVDGQELERSNNVASTGATPSIDPGRFLLGTDQVTLGLNQFAGSLEDVGFFRSVLGPDQINAIMQNGIASGEPGPIGSFFFDEQDGLSVANGIGGEAGLLGGGSEDAAPTRSTEGALPVASPGSVPLQLDFGDFKASELASIVHDHRPFHDW